MSLTRIGALPRLTLAAALMALTANSWAALTDEEAINKAGRQRMLSQRIAKLYLAMAWKVPAPGLDSGFSDALQQYDNALQTLSQAPENTAAIATALQRVRAQWSFSQAGFRQHMEGRYVPTVIMTTTETMLKQMNEVTTSYEQVMRQQRTARAR